MTIDETELEASRKALARFNTEQLLSLSHDSYLTALRAIEVRDEAGAAVALVKVSLYACEAGMRLGKVPR